MKLHSLPSFAFLAVLLLPSITEASLVDIGNGAIYDTTLDITLTKNVRFHEIDLYDNNRLYPIIGTSVLNSDGSARIVTSVDLYQVLPASTSFRVGGTWWGASAWAQTLTFAGASDWRLPTQAELVHVLDDPSYPTIFDKAISGSSYLMWTSTELTPSTVIQVQTIPLNWANSPNYYVSSIQKSLDQSDTFIQVPWAVHSGKISDVPVPATSLLLLTGSLLLGALAHRQSRSET